MPKVQVDLTVTNKQTIPLINKPRLIFSACELLS